MLDLMYRYYHNQEHNVGEDCYGLLYLKGSYYRREGIDCHLISRKRCSVASCDCSCSCCINADKKLESDRIPELLAEIRMEALKSSIILHVKDRYVKDTSTPTTKSKTGNVIIGNCTRLTDIYIKDGKNIEADWTLAYSILDDHGRNCDNKFCRCECKCCLQRPFEMNDIEARIFSQWLSYAEMLYRYKMRYIANLDLVQDDMALHPEDFVDGFDMAKLRIDVSSIDDGDASIYDAISPWCLALTKQCKSCNSVDVVSVMYKADKVDICLRCLSCSSDYIVDKGKLVQPSRS